MQRNANELRSLLKMRKRLMPRFRKKDGLILETLPKKTVRPSLCRKFWLRNRKLLLIRPRT